LRRLLFDIGNSALKWAFAEDRELQAGSMALVEDVDLASLFDHEIATVAAPDEIWVSSVAGRDIGARVSARCEHHWSREANFAGTEKQRAGLINAYETPASMGVDRWLAMLALWGRLHDAFCIVDCGTAITFDVVDGDGRHLGGQIGSGLGTMRRTLSTGTANIGEVDDVYEGDFAATTDGCVASGTLGQVVGMIERGVAQAAKALGKLPHCVITGGDAAAVRPHLDTSFEYDPLVVLRGLLVYADS
jgi:type III pantothenate kinase